MIRMKMRKEAIFTNSSTFKRFLLQAVDVLEKNHINYCIIGGVSLFFYDHNRMTTDVDFLVDRSVSEVQLLFIQEGYKKTTRRGVFSSKFPDLEVEFISQGERLTTPGIEYPDPQRVRIQKDYFGKSLWVISLKELIHSKMGAYIHTKTRLKDGGDVQELVKSNMDLVRDIHFPELDVETAWQQMLSDTLL